MCRSGSLHVAALARLCLLLCILVTPALPHAMLHMGCPGFVAAPVCMYAGVKHVHVLPAVVAAAQLTHELEAALAQGVAAAAADNAAAVAAAPAAQPDVEAAALVAAQGVRAGTVALLPSLHPRPRPCAMHARACVSTTPPPYSRRKRHKPTQATPLSRTPACATALRRGRPVWPPVANAARGGGAACGQR